MIRYINVNLLAHTDVTSSPHPLTHPPITHTHRTYLYACTFKCAYMYTQSHTHTHVHTHTHT